MSSFFTTWLEGIIRDQLTKVREDRPDNYTVSTFSLFTFVTHANSGVTAAEFNKAVGDLKRAGVVGTAKGGELVYLSNAAWELRQQVKAVRS